MSVELTPEVLAHPHGAYGRSSDSVGTDAQERHWRLIRATLRGRYQWVVLVSLVLGALGASVGWFLKVPMYRSGVPIRVAPVLQRVLYQDEEKGQLPGFERFVDTQIALIRGQRVMEGAVDRLTRSIAWRAVHVKGDARAIDGAILDFSDNVAVVRNNELVIVYVMDSDPKSAMEGAQAVVDTFKNLYLENDSESEKARLTALQQRQTALSNDLQGKRQQMAAITDGYGAQDLNTLYSAKFEEFRRLQGTLAELQLDLNLAVAGIGDTDGSLSVDDLSLADPILASLAQQRDRVESTLSSMQVRGVLAQNPQVQEAKAELEILERKMAARVTALQKSPRGLILGANRAGGAAPLDPKRIQAQVSQVEKMMEKAKQEMLDLYRADIQVTLLRGELDGIDKQLEGTRQRIDQLNIESRVNGRITVLGEAERPLQPFVDPRRKYATMGGIGGSLGGCLLVLMLGLSNPKLRHSDEMRVKLSLSQILGLLPSLPQDLSDPDQAAVAAHAVHHIRAMLQIRTQGAATAAFAVTSPVAGAGKTSLTLGLGLSFASAGSKTLLIDCDLIGAGLTSRLYMMLQQKLGRMLVSRGLLSEAQLELALQFAQGSETRFLEHLSEMGCPDAVNVAVKMRLQNSPALGLLETLQGQPLTSCITETDIPGLWILPLGGASPRHATSLAPAAIKDLLEAAKEQFDTVVVDTGPVPGSLEASVVSAEADGVVVIVSRGESARLAENCFAQLRAVGARLAGTVFNRALDNDTAMGSSIRDSSTALMRSRSSAARDPVMGIDRRGDFGPVAHAVASTSATVPIGSRRRASVKPTSNGGAHK